MRIVCINSSIRFGGAERQFVGLASLLAARGHDVTAVTYRPGDFYAAELQQSGARHVRLDLPLNGAGMRTLADFLRRQDPDVVVTFMSGAGIRASYVKKKYGLRCKVTVSDRNLTTRFNPFDYIKYHYFKMADLWLPNSYSQERYLKKRFPSLEARIKAIPNFCDTEVFCPVNGVCMDRDLGHGLVQGAEYQPVRVVTAARLCKRKNALRWMDAVARVAAKRDDFTVQWVGSDADDAFLAKCRRRIAALGLEGRFEILPKTCDVLDVYRSADVFCLPSLYEGTPNSLCEALSCGLPALCSDVSDNSLYVREGVSGFLFNPSSVEDMARALDKMLSLSALQRLEMGAEGSRIVASLMSKELFADRYEHELRTLCGM